MKEIPWRSQDFTMGRTDQGCLSSLPNCHPEQREGSWFLQSPSPLRANTKVPRSARDDKRTLEAYARGALCGYDASMRHSMRFLWNATKGHRLAPWRSPYLLWRIETYCGVKMTQIGFIEFWEFLWRERTSLWRFLKWTGEMDRYVRPKSSQ
jgi:hypothetical protein